MNLDVANGLLWYIIFLYSTVCHEASHAWTALKLGDDTAARGGQVTLDPWPHIRREPLGMVLMPIASWVLGGWLMGWASAPYSRDWARAYPKRAAMMAVAGPAANLALVLTAGLLLRLGLEWREFLVPFGLNANRLVTAAHPGIFEFLAHALSVVYSLNLLLFVFNLMPIPPLDGSSVPLLFLPEKAATWYFEALRSPTVRFIGLMIIMRGLGSFFMPVLRFAASQLYVGIQS